MQESRKRERKDSDDNTESPTRTDTNKKILPIHERNESHTHTPVSLELEREEEVQESQFQESQFQITRINEFGRFVKNNLPSPRRAIISSKIESMRKQVQNKSVRKLRVSDCYRSIMESNNSLKTEEILELKHDMRFFQSQHNLILESTKQETIGKIVAMEHLLNEKIQELDELRGHQVNSSSIIWPWETNGYPHQFEKDQIFHTGDENSDDLMHHIIYSKRKKPTITPSSSTKATTPQTITYFQ